MALIDSYKPFTEQDTVDTLVLPYLTHEHGFPGPHSLDYQAQHNLIIGTGGSGRYDGLYLSGGYPYVVLEAKRYAHDLTPADAEQARGYAVSDFFDKPVPYLVVSNGREHQFFKLTATISPTDHKLTYAPIPATSWADITTEPPGEVRQLLSQAQLLDTLRSFKRRTSHDLAALFSDPATSKLDPTRHPLGTHLEAIVTARRNFSGETATAADASRRRQQALRQAIEAIALHFTIKILFIKLIEDLSRGSDSPRIIHSLFPQQNYDSMGGLFGYKVLNALDGADRRAALKLYTKANGYYRKLSTSLARVTWQDIFRYGFSVHTAEFGQLFKAKDYDRFLPTEDTLAEIQHRLIEIDIRTAIIYGSATKRTNVIGDIYEQLIDEELRSGLGAIYTPDDTMRFMVELGSQFLGGFRGKKIVEPACGSGHFYREIYRRYVDEVFAASDKAHQPRNEAKAHVEALEHVFGRDIDPFAVQLTLLSTFLEQLKDNIKPGEDDHRRLWLADRAIDTQNSLDPITVDPGAFFDMEKTGDLDEARSLLASCRKVVDPHLMIGNPPYGVSVVKGANYNAVYDLQSNDSYGYFIVNALKRLREGGRLNFIVSSSFLTIGSHRKLRAFILAHSKVVRVIKLHRATFPGIDVFPVVIELERCSNPAARASNIYTFYDLWRLHPAKRRDDLVAAYDAILSDLEAKSPWPFDPTVSARYTVRQGVLPEYHGTPIFEGRRSLYEFMADPPAKAPEATFSRADGTTITAPVSTVRGRNLVKLAKIAEVRIGLQSGDNGRFYKVAAGVKGGATRGGYQEVQEDRIVSQARIDAMTADERVGGLEIDDPTNDPHFVPLDKAGASDIEGGLLPLFYRPVEFYVDWGSEAVGAMKALPGAVFRNSQYYFKNGITYSTTGIYSPTFRLSHGGVFDQKSSNIFCDVMDPYVLLGILCSTLIRYLGKSFINHGVDAQLDELPIALPTPEEAADIKQVVEEIVAAQKADPAYDYRPKLAELDALVNALYGLSAPEVTELEVWYRRHYPNLTEQPDEGAADGDEEATEDA